MEKYFRPNGGGTVSKYGFAAAITLILIVGYWLRVRNLGDLSLMVDEGVEVLAVRAILETGVPRMESGLVYLRFPLFLYLQAAFAHLFELNEFWLRFPGVIFGVAAVVPTYFLGKLLINRPVGALAAAIVALSAWQIELSRYGRPYIALQFFFLVALIYLYRGFLLDEDRNKSFFLIAAFFAFLTHELSQVLAVVFLIPLIYPAISVRRRLWFGVWGLALGALMIVVRKFSTFYLPEGVSYASPEGAGSVSAVDRILAAVGIPPIHGPDMSYFAEIMQQQSFVMLALMVVGGLATVYVIYQSYKQRQFWRGVLSVMMIWAAFIYQFALVGLIFVLYLASFARNQRILRDRILIAGAGAALVCFGVWFVALVASPRLVVVEVPLLLFSFPDIYKYLLRWLVKGWPVLTAGLAGGSVWLFLRFLKDRTDAAALFLLGALYFPALFASLFESSFVPVYTLHLYPLVALIFAASAWKVGTLARRRVPHARILPKPIALSLALPALFLAIEDANLRTAWSVTERTYETEKHPIRNVMTFRVYSDFHQDFQGPGRFVKAHRAPGDIVVAIGMDYATQLYHYYAGGVDFGLTTPEYVQEFGLQKGGGPVHYTTGHRYITTPEELLALVRTYRGRIWLLGDRRVLREGYPMDAAESLKEIVRDWARAPDFVGRDGVTFAVKVQ